LCYSAGAVPDKLPEEFAPTGPKLSKFPIRPAPPIRPHLFADEARFALRLSILAGATEFVAWFWLAADRHWSVLALAGLRLLKPVWAKVGTRFPRPAIALILLFAPLLAWATTLLAVWYFHSDYRFFALGVAAAGLPAVGDLCATCVADSVTVERRAAAYAWLDIGQGLGAALGFVAPHLIRGDPLPSVVGWYSLSVGALLIAAIGARELHDRGVPRSSWPLASYASVMRSSLGLKLIGLAFGCAALAVLADRAVLWKGFPFIPRQTLESIPPWVRIVVPLAGMAIAARVERFMPNAITLPRAATGCAAVGLYLSFWPLSVFGMGVMFAAIPAAVARGAGEMERPIASSLAWSALIAGAALGAVL
jgi:hypothetical protein